MKILKRFVIILMITGAGCLLYFGGAAKDVSQKAADVIATFYGVKKADAVNSESVDVYVNGEKLSEPSLDIFMNERLIWLAKAGTVSRIFKCEVNKIDDHTVSLIKDGKTFTFNDSSDIVTTPDGDKLYQSALIFKKDMIALSVEAAAELFGGSFSWDEESRKIEVTVPEDKTAELPERFDLRNESRVPEARSQGNLGTCWAFAALSAIESTLLPDVSESFAVDHLSLMNGFNISQNDGGDYNIALAYMASWKGPVYERDDPYGDNVTDASLEPVRHLQEAVNIQAKDYKKIKQMVYEYGAVQSSFYSDIEIANVNSEYYNSAEASYYYNGKMPANHDIIIIGWDDHYSADNFNHRPKNDGAFICQNSWGKEFGDDGCFYVSYEDTNIGVNNMVYTKIENADNYDKIYQSDSLGWIGAIGYNEPFAYFANKYHADGLEALKAVSFYATGPDTDYEVYAVCENAPENHLTDMEFLTSGHIEEAGYYTVKIPGSISVSGDFAVVVKMITKDSVHPVAIEYHGENHEFKADLSDGEGYISYNGKYWQRVEDNYDCNLCLKAFTDKIS